MHFHLIRKIKLYVNILNDIFHDIFQKDSWQQLKHCDVLLVRHDNDCGYRFHGQAYAHIIDTFGDLCEKRDLIVRSVATPHSRLTGKLAYRSPVSYNNSLNYIDIFGVIVRILRGSDIKIKWINQRRMYLWCQILEKATPNYVIAIQPDEYLCKAGKKMRIPVYDLQHGAIADDHLWYGEAYRIDTPSSILPDGFLCWDDKSVTTLSKWTNHKGITVIKVGNPWFLRFSKNQADDLLVSEANAQIKIIHDARPTILVTLQCGLTIFPDRIPNGVMNDSLEQVILETGELYNWIIRLHPVQLHGIERDETIKYLITTFGEEKTHIWIKSSEIPLPVILKNVNLHITYYSSTVIEAAWMGIRSGILNEQFGLDGKYQSFFFHELSSGIANILPNDTYIIKQWITDTLAKGCGQSTPKDTGQNLDDFIDEIVGRKS
jgi:hypothetical protein